MKNLTIGLKLAPSMGPAPAEQKFGMSDFAIGSIKPVPGLLE